MPPKRPIDWPGVSELREGETPWGRLARLRQLRAQLDDEITTQTPEVVRTAKASGVRVEDLAEMWGVTAAWIYKVAPARVKRVDRS